MNYIERKESKMTKLVDLFESIERVLSELLEYDDDVILFSDIADMVNIHQTGLNYSIIEFVVENNSGLYVEISVPNGNRPYRAVRKV